MVVVARNPEISSSKTDSTLQEEKING
jgi:hypothetical protein